MGDKIFSHIDEINQTKQDLNSVSPSFCLAKWSMATIHLQQGETHSCYHPWTHKIPSAEIDLDPSALHNTIYKKEQRRLMLKGERPKECQYCWNIEDLGPDFISDRMIRSNEPWAKSDMNQIKNSSWDANINPKHLEISFDSICQLKCIYCNPTVSSTWREEVKKFGGYKTSNKFNDYAISDSDREGGSNDVGNNPYVKAFWDWWPGLYNDLKVLRITGGEPLLSKDTFKILDYILKYPHPNLEIIINSNLSVSDPLIDRLIDKMKMIMKNSHIKKFTLFGSIDTFGAQAEYIRTGLSYERFIKNTRRILDEIPSGVMAFTVTCNALSVVRFKSFLEEIVRLRQTYNQHGSPQRIFFDTPYLRFPGHLSIQTLPKSFVKYFDMQISYMQEKRDSLFGFLDIEIEKMKRVREWMLQNNDQEKINIDRLDLVIYLDEHDRRRGTCFLETFPEMKEFYSSVKKGLLNELD